MVIFGFLYGVPYGVDATYMTESFQAKYRGTAIAPIAIGFIATQHSIGLGFLVMGAAYFICGVIPALFIKDKQFDPQKQYESRLLPTVFKGSILTSWEIDNLSLDISRLERINKRDSSDYEPIAVTTCGRRGTVVNPGMNASGSYDFINANYQLHPNWLVNLAHGDLDDIYRQTMLNTTHTWQLGERRWFKTDLRYARSVGQQQALIDNHSYGAMFTYGFGDHSLATAYQSQSGKTGFAYINGTDPYLVNFVQINAFANRDEKSWQLKYTYDFSEIGIPGLTFMTRYISGDNVERADGREGKEWEHDMDIAYTIQGGTFKGLNLMWRNASSRGDAEIGNNNQDENRLIAAYTWKLW